MATNRRKVRPLTFEELEALPTKRLLEYRDKLLGLEPLRWSDISQEQLDALEPGVIYFQDSAEWATIYSLVKSLLDTREHIDR